MFQLPSQAPLRAVRTPASSNGFYDSSIKSGWTIPERAVHERQQRPQGPVPWWRQRMMGGRTNHWAASRCATDRMISSPGRTWGSASTWPISYDDLAPYYDKVENADRVFGANDGVENVPSSSPGVLLPPASFAPASSSSSNAAANRHERDLLPSRVLSVRQDGRHDTRQAPSHNVRAQRILADSMRQRAPCFWAKTAIGVRNPGQLPIDHGSSRAGAGHGQSRHPCPMPWCAKSPSTTAASQRSLYIDKTTGLEHQ